MDAKANLDQALIRELRKLLAEQAGVAPEEVSEELIRQHRDLFLAEYSKRHSSRCLHLMFEQSVRQDPEQAAVLESAGEISRARLNARANQMARCLQARGVGPETVAALCLPLSSSLIEALLGILKAGAAFALIDPAQASARGRELLNRIRPELLLADEGLPEAVSSPAVETLWLQGLQEESDGLPDGDLDPQANPENLALLSCTFEGILQVEHREVCGLLERLQEEFEISPSDGMLAHSLASWEPALWHLFWPLACGGRLILGGKDSPHAVQANMALVTPRRLDSWLQQDNGQWLASARLVFAGGGPLRQRTAERFYSRGGQRLLSIYTPPGTAGGTIWLDCSACRDWETAPIGASRSLLILDHDLQPVPVGLSGEICLAWQELPRGWRDAPGQTAQNFSMHPFTSEAGARLVRTRDRGRRLEDGTSELQGSLGRLCRLAGQRIDLGRVEAALRLQEGIDDAALLLRQTEQGTRLTAFAVPAGLWQPERLQDCLRRLLPDGSPPCALLPVNRLPLRASGAVDETELARLEVVDEQLASDWEEALKSVEGIQEAAVIVDDSAQPPPALHLGDLLPGSKPLAAAPAQDQGQAVGQADRVEEGPSQVLQPSISHGPPLPQGIPATLAQALQRAAEQGADQGVSYIHPDGKEDFHSYAELLQEARRVMGGLRACGLEPQDKVIFQLEELRDFVTVFWGCQLGGFIPVPLSIAPSYQETNAAVRKLHNIWQMLERPLVAASPSLLEALESLQGLLGLQGWRVRSAASLGSAAPDEQARRPQPQDPALLLFTSGSTGRPKGVVQTHQALLSRSAATAQMNGFTPEDVSLNWMPLDHVGGVVMFHLRDVYVGCRQVQAPTAMVLEDPLRWLDWIERHRASITWAPNFAFGLVNDRSEEIAQRSWDLSSMRFVLNGGEAIVARTARRFLQLLIPHGLPPAAMKPAWGMSETCSGVAYSHNFSLEASSDNDPFVEVGAPVPGFSQRIVDAQDQPVEEGKPGRLQVKGEMVTVGYYGDEELNDESFTPDGWFNTGDLGVLRQGRLTITGREKDVIIINGINYYSHEIESLAEEVDGVEVSYTAAFAVRETGSQTDRLAVLFHSPASDFEHSLATAERVRERIAAGAGLKASYVVPVEKESIPKTAIGKIQRPLLRQRFEAGKFSETLKRIDIATRNANTLPDWFFRPVWRARRLPAGAAWRAEGQWLVVAGRQGLGEQLGRRLQRRAIEWTLLQPGGKRECIQALRRLDGPVTAVLHLRGYGEGENSSQESASLLHLLQALDSVQGGERSVRLLTVSSHSQCLEEGESIDCRRASIPALLKTASQELPWLRASHLDLPPGEGDRNIRRILAEMGAPAGDREAAYRQGRRLAARLEQVELGNAPPREIPFREGGLWLLSGGRGGIGRRVARCLAERWPVHLLLTGRGALPKKESWLQELGSQAAYQAVDSTDPEALLEAVSQAEQKWDCRLSGVLHLSGLLWERSLLEETPEGLEEALRPKLGGVEALDRLLQERPEAWLIAFSSVNGFFGGAGVGAYAAANRAMEAFCRQRRLNSRPKTLCLSWSMWEGVGLSRGYASADASRARGFAPIQARQGLDSLLAVLGRETDDLLIGLDAANRHIRRHWEGAPLSQRRLYGFYSLDDAAGTARLDQLQVLDGRGEPSSCQFAQVPQLPRDEAGRIDRQRLLAEASGRSASTPRQAGPRTGLERRLAEIWQKVLGREQLSIHDNYFQLGGDSILSIQIVARAAEVGLRLTPQMIFQNPSVAQLALQVEQAAPQAAASQERVEGEVLLTPVQHWFFEQNPDHPHHFNMSLLLSVQQRLKPALLERALLQLIDHHDALRLRFEQRQGKWRQFNAAQEENRFFSWIDLSRLPSPARPEAIEAVAVRLQSSLNLPEGPLLRAAGFDRGPGSSGRLLVIVHHLAVDGVSWRILLEDLQTAYRQAEEGQPLRLPPKTTSFQEWARRLNQYAQSDELASQIEHWTAPQPDFPALPLDMPEGVNNLSNSRTLTLSLSRQETRNLLQEAQQAYQTQINDLLLCALALSFQGWLGQAPLLIGLEGHGREDLFDDVDLSRSLGWFTSIFPVQLDLDGESDPGLAIKKVKEQLRRIPEKGIGYGLLRYLHPEQQLRDRLSGRAQPQLSFNYLGQFDQTLPEQGALSVAPEPIGPSSCLSSQRPCLFDVSAHVIDGRLEVAWMYGSQIHRKETAQGLADGFADWLRRLVDHCLSSPAGGFTPSDFPLAGLDQIELDDLLQQLQSQGVERRQIESIYPLSAMQQGMLFQAVASDRPGVYFEQFSCQIEGRLDLDAFRESWQLLTARHTALRTFFAGERTQRPLQLVLRQVEVPLHLQDWRELAQPLQQQRLESFLKEDRQRGFQLWEAPQMRLALIRSGEQAWRLVWSFNHLLLDGWSLPLIFRDVLGCYQSLRQGQPVHPQPSRPYSDYIQWLQEQDSSRAESYWRQRLEGFRRATPLEAGEAPQEGGGHSEARWQLSEPATEQIRSFARRHRLTLNGMSQGAWALLLSSLSGEEDVVFGATVSGRPPQLEGVETMVGLFINTLPVRVRIDQQAELLPWLGEVQQQQAELQPYETTPLPQVHEWSEVPKKSPLFESILVFENFPIDQSVGEQAEGLQIRDVRSIEQSNFPLAVMVLMEERMTLIAYFDSGRFQQEAALKMLRQFAELLQQMAAAPEGRLADLPFVGEAEEKTRRRLARMQERNLAEEFNFG